jgi:hypothetical protein
MSRWWVSAFGRAAIRSTGGAQAGHDVDRVGAAQGRDGPAAAPVRLRAGEKVVAAGRALHDRLVEQAAHRWRGELGADAEAAEGLTPQGHVARVAAEGADVGLHPAQRRLLVGEHEVAGVGVVQRGVAQEAEGAEPVVDRHDDHLPGPGHRRGS